MKAVAYQVIFGGSDQSSGPVNGDACKAFARDFVDSLCYHLSKSSPHGDVLFVTDGVSVCLRSAGVRPDFVRVSWHSLHVATTW